MASGPGDFGQRMIIATDEAQGYENKLAAITMFDKVTGQVLRLKQLD